MPYSRATIELWLSGPPTSVTTPAAIANSGVQAGVVIRATSTSPGCMLAKSSGPCSSRAGALTCPELAPTPVMTSPACCWVRAGIMLPNARSIQRLSGSSCGAAAFRWPRHSILRCSTASARTGRSVPVMAAPGVASPKSIALRSSSRRSQKMSGGAAMTPEAVSRFPSSSSMRLISGQASPTSASASSRTGAAFCAQRSNLRKTARRRGPSLALISRPCSSRRSADRCWRSCGSFPCPRTKYLRVSSRAEGSSAGTGLTKSRL